MNETNVSNTRKVLKIVGENAFGNELALKLPVDHLIIRIDVNLDCAYFSLWSWLAHCTPSSRLLFLVSLRIMNLSISKMEAQGFFADLVLHRSVVFRHDSDFNAVDR